MKRTILVLAGLLVFIGCNKKKSEETISKEQTVQKLTFDQFEEAPVINDINKVAFLVYPKNSKIKLYVQPDEESSFLEENFDVQETLFGETEVSNFYKIIYQVNNNPQNSKFAYVLKSEVDKDNELLLSEKDDLAEIRYININGKTLDGIKSLNSFATIELIDKAVYNDIYKKHPQNLLSNNNKPEVVDNFYIFRLRNGELKKIPKKTEEEDGVYELQVLGFSKELDRQFFQVLENKTPTGITAISTINNELNEIYFSSFPSYLKSSNLIANINNDEVGSLLVIQKYNPQDYTFQELYAINFTNFKIANPRNLIWDNNSNLYAEVHHPNTKTSTKNYKKQYVKITLNNL